MLDFLNLDSDIIDIIFDTRINNLVLEIENIYNKIKKGTFFGARWNAGNLEY